MIHYTRSNPDPNPPPVFENPNLIPKILRRQENQENSASSRPLYRSRSCPVRWIYPEDKPFDEYLKISSFVTFSESGLTHTVQDPIFIEHLQLEVVTSHFDRHLQNSIHSEITSEGTPNLFVITTASPSSPSAPQTSQPQATPSTSPSTTHIPIVIPSPPVVTSTSATMANQYTPLHLPANPGAMPQDYQSKITSFEGIGTYTTQQHTKKMTDYFEIYEVDADDVRMKAFVQSLTGDVRTWFRALPTNSINDPQALYQTFLNRWEKKKYPLHILSKYENLRRGTQETVQDYCTRFNNVYNAITQNLRPPPNLALIKFPDAFDSDMAYQLREIAPQNLEEMQSIAVSVEANLISKQSRARAERRTPFKEEPSAFEQKLDAIIKGIGRLGDRVETIERKSPWDGQPGNTGRNPNFRKNQNPNTGKTDPDQNIRPPFQEKYVEASTSDEPTEDTQINLMGLNNEQQVFLT